MVQGGQRMQGLDGCYVFFVIANEIERKIVV